MKRISILVLLACLSCSSPVLAAKHHKKIRRAGCHIALQVSPRHPISIHFQCDIANPTVYVRVDGSEPLWRGELTDHDLTGTLYGHGVAIRIHQHFSRWELTAVSLTQSKATILLRG